MFTQVCEMTDFSELYKRLEEERKWLNAELEQLKGHSGPSDERREGSSFGKREEGATETFEFERSLALKKQMTDALAKVNHALEKYKAGTYGTCDRCGQLIDPARLEALPYADLCLNCKANQTKDSKSRSTR